MDTYILMIVALALLAILDLVVGVSNDAINFLNSAMGSKAISIKKIMFIASLGIIVGAISSSGMMEVARKGIFIPGHFYFNEIMYIFLAVMLTDILLLDIFNILGMPTSTTVSIVFELLGAAVAMALIKMYLNDDLSTLATYINSQKALQIISGILLSVIVAFSVGALVQFFTRLVYSFQIESKSQFTNALFGGFALTFIMYFILIKGLKTTPFYGNLKDFIEGSNIIILGICFCVGTFLSYVFIRFFRWNIFKIIIGIGTFSLAMAFAGNDLVNFIGVPIAAWNSYAAWHGSGIAAENFSMEILAEKVPSNTYILILAGFVMVITLWFSKKARKVMKTEIDLSRQNENKEKFNPNFISRSVVRFFIGCNHLILLIFPKKTIRYINSRFEIPVLNLPKNKIYTMPAFDMIRASINIVVAGILITMGTSLKLPLSTTYVTFMVAMGTSLADRAWGRESAVYRVAGVLNVIGGWFLTAIAAFTVAAIFLFLIHLGGAAAISVLLIFVLGWMLKNYIQYKKQNTTEKMESDWGEEEKLNIQQVVKKSSAHIILVLKAMQNTYGKTIQHLEKKEIHKLKKNKKSISQIQKEINSLRDGIFYFIKSLDEFSEGVSKFYLFLLGYLQDITQSMGYISKISYDHINNNHKNLKKKQIKYLQNINIKLGAFLQKTYAIFENHDFENLSECLHLQEELLEEVSFSIDNQVISIRSAESSPKNTTLYFGILLETKDLITYLSRILDLYQDFYIKFSKQEK